MALDKSFAAIEQENTSLEMVLTATNFGDKGKLNDELLQRLLRHFNQYSLRSAELYKPDILGNAYDYLIQQFADDTGKKGGEFYAPRVKKLSQQTGLAYQQLKFQRMEKRWGSCTETNNIILNTEAVKLPFTLIDYIIYYPRALPHSGKKPFQRILGRALPPHPQLEGAG